MKVLGIESSCDDTSVAILETPDKILSDPLVSQIKVHSPYGGVVPEIASREHLRTIVPLYDKAMDDACLSLKDIDLIAVTMGPGLIGSLLVGLCFAKSLSYFSSIPIVGVDHVKAHLFSIFLNEEVPFPFIGLVVSGGHTVMFEARKIDQVITLGHTRDDAAGEAFDKVGKFLGLGYPGGIAIDRLSESGDPGFIHFPRAFLKDESYEFSFSGLKTAVVNYVRREGENYTRKNLHHICASFQEAVVEVLTEKMILGARKRGIEHLVLSGGVAANSRLRTRLGERVEEEGFALYVPPVSFCTDNALMVASFGFRLFECGYSSSFGLNAYPNIRY